MKKYTVYTIATGQITQCGECQDAALATFPLVEGQAILEDVAISSDFVLVDGAPVAIPERPSPHHTFDYTIKQWIDPRTLNDLKATKKQEINAARLTANRGTFTFIGKQISCDELSRSDIDGVNGSISLTGVLPANWPGGWKTADNSYVAISDVTTWISFYNTMVAQGQANFAHSQALKAELAREDITAEEIAAITW